MLSAVEASLMRGRLFTYAVEMFRQAQDDVLVLSEPAENFIYAENYFHGQAEFAVSTLKSLLAWPGGRVVAVLTAPDRSAGRGRQLQASAVKAGAEAHGLSVLQPSNLKSPESQAALVGYSADLQVVVAFRMLPEAVWNMPRLGSINIHASLLPQYRGAAPINWAIMHGNTETGVTSFFLRHEIDTSDLIYQDRLAIAPEDDFGSLHDKLKLAGAALARRSVEAVAAGTAPSILQAQRTDLRPRPSSRRKLAGSTLPSLGPGW